jgi:predicted ATPase/Flp pilus assembly protein TadD
VAQRQLVAGSFGGGVFFVPLTDVSTPDFLITTIAQSLNFSFSGQLPPQEQLLNYLREKQLLLVLDNFEQLAAEVTMLAEILETASGVKLLVTSRVQLNLYEEWLLEVQGLAVPEMEAADWESASSVQLFQQRARRVFLGFDLQGEKTAVIHICQLVGGMPLSLELAAAWVRTLSCTEIAKEIGRNLDFLTSTTQSLPERQRSLRATFDYSWQLLPAPEQEILTRLTVFRGGFTREAAEVVAGASLRSLSLLVDKSFVRRGTDGRYQIHESLGQFAGERLNEAMVVQQKQARFYGDFIHLSGEEVWSQAEMSAVLADIDNVRRAWQTAVSQQNIDLISHMLEGLYRFYMTRGWHQEGVSQLAQAAAQLADTPGTRSLLGRLWLRQGYCGQVISTDLTASQQLYEQGLAVARQSDDKGEEALALSGLGFAAIMQSQYAEAERFLRESVAICRELGQQRMMGNSLNLLAGALLRQGAFDRAKTVCQEALQVRRAVLDESGIASSLTILGSIECTLGEYDEARTIYQEALQLCRQLDHKVGMANALTGLFQTAFYSRDREGAAAYIRESLVFYREAGDRWGMAIALHNLAFFLADGEEHEEAIARFTEAVALYRQIGVKSSLANTLKSLAVSYLALGERDTAVTHFYEALQLAISSNVAYIMAEVLLEIALMWLKAGRKAWAAALLRAVKNAAETKDRFRTQAEETLKSLQVDGFDDSEGVDWGERPLVEVAPLILEKLG